MINQFVEIKPKLILRQVFLENQENILEQILNVFKNAIEGIDQKLYDENQKQVWIELGIKDISKWQEHIKNDYFIIAECKSKIIGFSSIKNSGEIDLLYVDSAFQGQRVASKMYVKLLDFATKNEIVQLSTHASKAALPFFKKRGFKIITKNKIEIEGEILVNYTMEKPLEGIA